MARAPKPLSPKTIEKPQGRRAHPVADHGVFKVERLVYEVTPLPRDIFVFAVPDWCVKLPDFLPEVFHPTVTIPRVSPVCHLAATRP